MTPLVRTARLATAALLVTITPGSKAFADPAVAARTAALSWVREPGAEECPAGPAIAAEVARVIGESRLGSLAQADVIIEGRVAPKNGGFETVLTVTARSGAMLGTRKLDSQSASCASIRADVGLVIALMIDPDAAMRPPSALDDGASPGGPGRPSGSGLSTSQSGPETSPSPSLPQSGSPSISGGSVIAGAPLSPMAPSVVCAPAPPPAPPAERWNAAISVGAAMEVGLLPSPGFGARGRITITPPRLFPVEIGGAIFAPVRLGAADQGVEAQLATAFVRACPIAPKLGRFAFTACLGLDAGSLHGAGFGFDVNQSAEMPVAAAAFGGRADVRLGSIVHASFGADLAIPFVRGRFFYDASDGTQREAFLTSPIAGTFDLALGLALP